MDIQQAKKFIEMYSAGDYMPPEHDAFIKWAEQASEKELNEIADLYEDQAAIVGGHWNPSPEWVLDLERKLDQADNAAIEKHARLCYITGWVRGMYLKIKFGIFKNKK